MKIQWKTEKSSETAGLMQQERQRLIEDRSFWDFVVGFAEPETEAEADRAAKIADRLLEHRRKRFPI